MRRAPRPIGPSHRSIDESIFTLGQLPMSTEEIVEKGLKWALERTSMNVVERAAGGDADAIIKTAV